MFFVVSELIKVLFAIKLIGRKGSNLIIWAGTENRQMNREKK